MPGVTPRMPPALSFVIPLYYSAETIVPLVKSIEALEVEGGHEIVLVNDGSRDATAGLCRELIREARVPITFVSHARNYGEHNAVLTGYRHARGAHIVNLDDDGQNPPAEALRLWRHARDEGVDAVYGHYADKKHASWRNFGSWFTNRMSDLVLDKPAGFYLSSFRCVNAFVARVMSSAASSAPGGRTSFDSARWNFGSRIFSHSSSKLESTCRIMEAR